MDKLKADTGFNSNYINASARVILIRRTVETKIFKVGISFVKKNGCFFRNSRFLR